MFVEASLEEDEFQEVETLNGEERFAFLSPGRESGRESGTRDNGGDSMYR